MKKTYVISTLFLLVLAFSSCDKSARNGKIDRDCTGTYLRLNKKDYLICNPAMTDSYVDGSDIRVKFKFKSKCDNTGDHPVCELYHKSYGFVEITEIK